MFSLGPSHPVFAIVAVFLTGLLASRPVAAETGKGTESVVATEPQAPGGVFVEVKSSSRPVRIDRVFAPGVSAPMCVSPCRQVLPRDGVYVITGDRVCTTSPFVLPHDRDRVVLDVHPGSSGNATFGSVAAGGGLLSMVLGLVFVLQSDLNSIASDSEEKHNKGPGKTVGGLMMLGGLMVGIVGICLMVGGRTEVTSSSGTHFTDTPAPKRSRFALTARGLEF